DAIREARRRLDDDSSKLERLATAAEGAQAICRPPKGHHGTVVRYLVFQDLAAIFEYSTNEPAERRVRGEDHPEAGKDYGPFWEFSYAAWSIIFPSHRGLSA